MDNKSIQVKDIEYKYTQLSDYLNEKSRCLWAATEANSIGWGEIGIVSRATGLSYPTIRKGIQELSESDTNKSRLRKRGGRKSIVNKNEAKGLLDEMI